MLLIVLFIMMSLPVGGDLKLTLDAASFPTGGDGAVLELSYRIPHSSLVFLRDSAGFRAEFTVGIQLLDSRREPVAGDMWFRSVSVEDYDLTLTGDSSAAGLVEIGLPEQAVRARAEVVDLGSSRVATSSFAVDAPDGALRIRLQRRGEPNPTRSYGLEDTLEVMVEVLDETPVDSFRFVARRGRRVHGGGVVRARSVDDRLIGIFLAPIADSAGRAVFPNGSHDLLVTGFASGGPVSARASFAVLVPFYNDDEAWGSRVEELLFIASPAELRALRRLPLAERNDGWHHFWAEHDPTPTTDRNEKEEEYFERMEYAKEHFGHGDRGYRSDRARVYVRYGPPDNIESRPFEIDAHAYEIWHYYGLAINFLFVDRSGFGEYILDGPRTLDGP